MGGVGSDRGKMLFDRWIARYYDKKTLLGVFFGGLFLL